MNFEDIKKKINDMTVTDLQNFIQELKYNFKIEEASEDSSKQYETLINQINTLTVKQINDLVTDLETTFGVKASTSFGGGGESSDEGAASSAEKSSYTVIISGFKQDPSQKVKFIQALRGQASTIDLKGAMAIFETVSTGGNHTVFDNLEKDAANAFKSAMDPFVEITLK
jgi:ribosomal protein L7/L12